MLVHYVKGQEMAVVTLTEEEISKVCDCEPEPTGTSTYRVFCQLKNTVEINVYFRTDEEWHGHYSVNPCEDSSWSEEIAIKDSFEFAIYIKEDGEWNDYYELDEPSKAAIIENISNKF